MAPKCPKSIIASLTALLAKANDAAGPGEILSICLRRGRWRAKVQFGKAGTLANRLPFWYSFVDGEWHYA